MLFDSEKGDLAEMKSAGRGNWSWDVNFGEVATQIPWNPRNKKYPLKWLSIASLVREFEASTQHDRACSQVVKTAVITAKEVESGASGICGPAHWENDLPEPKPIWHFLSKSAQTRPTNRRVLGRFDRFCDSYE